MIRKGGDAEADDDKSFNDRKNWWFCISNSYMYLMDGNVVVH